MNPLIIWATRDVSTLDHSSDDERLAHQRVHDAHELPPLERDGRWVAAIRRWAEQDAVAAEFDGRDAAHAATRARHGAASRQPSPGW